MKLEEFLPIIADPSAKNTERLVRMAQFVANNGLLVPFDAKPSGFPEGGEYLAYAFRDLILVFIVSIEEAKKNRKAAEAESSILLQVLFSEDTGELVGSRQVCELNGVATTLRSVEEGAALSLLEEWSETPPTDREIASLH